jgi:hypothetical protein
MKVWTIHGQFDSRQALFAYPSDRPFEVRLCSSPTRCTFIVREGTEHIYLMLGLNQHGYSCKEMTSFAYRAVEPVSVSSSRPEIG